MTAAVTSSKWGMDDTAIEIALKSDNRVRFNNCADATLVVPIISDLRFVSHN